MGSKYKENICVTIDKRIKEWIDKHSVHIKKSALVNQILKQYVDNALEKEKIHIPTQYHLCEKSFKDGNENLDGEILGEWCKERGVWEFKCNNCGWYSMKKPRSSYYSRTR